MSKMLPKTNRLKKKKDFENVFKHGKGARGSFLALKFVKNGRKESRFGFIVSQKVSRYAVKRNKVKRRLRSVISSSSSLIKPGLDVAIITFSGIEDKTFQETKDILFKLLKDAKCLSLS